MTCRGASGDRGALCRCELCEPNETTCARCGCETPPTRLVEQANRTFLCWGCVATEDALDADERPASEGVLMRSQREAQRGA